MSQPSAWNVNQDNNDAVQKEEEDRFLEQLRSLGYDPYFYRKELFSNMPGAKAVAADLFLQVKAADFERVKNLGSPFIKPIDLGTVKHKSYYDLEVITDSFSQSNLIRETRHGRLYRGKINNKHDVIVKTWDFYFNLIQGCPKHTDRFLDELTFLRHPEIKSHPSVVNLIGFHCDKTLAVVYEGTMPDFSVLNILPSDEFGWEDRMKVANDIGSMLQIFHENNHVHGDIDSWRIMVDKNFCSKIYEFRTHYYSESVIPRYDPYMVIGLTGRDDQDGPGKWDMIDDVFMFGILLMELITKQPATSEMLLTWIKFLKEDKPKSIVHQSLDVDEGIASRITELALGCLRAKLQKNVNVNMLIVVQELKKIKLESSSTQEAKRQKLCV